MTENVRVDLAHLTVTLAAGDDATVYTFEGAVDESFRYRDIPVAPTEEVIFRLGAVHTLNSVGVREWISFVRPFGAKRRFELVEVSVAFVDQLNIVPQMLGRARVRSLFAPFYCPACDEEVNELLSCDEHRACMLARTAPALVHAPCGQPLEFDALEDCYFHQAERFLG